MQSLKTELTQVIYNAAEQAFEAKVTVHDDEQPVAYACSIEAPISMSFEDAAEGLTRQALRRHGAPTNGLRSVTRRESTRPTLRLVAQRLRRGLPVGQYGFFRGRAA